jgi:hypothetical protein
VLEPEGHNVFNQLFTIPVSTLDQVIFL